MALQEYFSITGPEELIKLLDTLSRPNADLNDAARAILNKLLLSVRNYPPPRPTYQRTYRLQNSWHLSNVGFGGGDSFGRVVSGGPEYNLYVKEAEEQSWVHKGRHSTTQDVAEDPEIAEYAVEVLERAYQMLIDKLP
jgi:hypothetical protein